MPQEEITDNGILYEWYLVSSKGAGFILFPESNHSKKDIKDAKQEIRFKNDVVSLRIATTEDIYERFRLKVFTDQRTKHLKWYQIDFEIEDWIKDKSISPYDFVSNNLKTWESIPVQEAGPLYQ